MSIGQINQQAQALRRSCEDQARLMNDFLRANRSNMQIVQSEFQGSSRGYDQRLQSSLRAAEEALKKSADSLQRARDALMRINF